MGPPLHHLADDIHEGLVSAATTRSWRRRQRTAAWNFLPGATAPASTRSVDERAAEGQPAAEVGAHAH